jgi:exosortase
VTEMSQSPTLDYRNAPVTVDPERIYFGLTLTTWIKIATVTALMAAVFWPNLRRLWLKTNPIWGEPNWGHSMVVPIIGLYYLYLNREELLKATVKNAWSGLFILLGGLLLYGYGIWPGQNDFVKDFGMVVTLFGVVLLLCGWQVMKTAWFPILFLVAAIPWPGLVYSWVAGPLQALAAKVAVMSLNFSGVQAMYSGTKIIITTMGESGPEPRTLNVAEACAGLRSLMTFIAVGAAVAFLSARPLWQKLLITASAVPIAIFCNVMRVSGQGMLDYYVSHELSEGFAHAFVGMIMLIPAFFLLLGVAWVIDHLFIEEVDDRNTLVAARAGGNAGLRPAAKPAVIEAPRRASRNETKPTGAVAVPSETKPVPATAAASDGIRNETKPMPEKPAQPKQKPLVMPPRTNLTTRRPLTQDQQVPPTVDRPAADRSPNNAQVNLTSKEGK